MASKATQPNPIKLEWICRVKEIDPSQVVAVDFDFADIFLTVRGVGQVRVERSALPARIEAMPDTTQAKGPLPSTAEAQPAPKPASRAKSDKRTRKRARARRA